jgi:hypothetical protein
MVTNVATQHWSQIVCEKSPPPRHLHGTTILGNKIYLFGGYNGDYLNDFWYFDLGTFCLCKKLKTIKMSKTGL